MLTYLPLELNNENCVEFVTNNIVRVYDVDPNNYVTSSYVDYYITDHYTSVSGDYSSSESVTCVSHDLFTDNVFYRYDLHDILISFTCIFFVSIFLIYFALKCFFKGLFK